MHKMGHHCLLNVYGCDFDLLDNEDLMISILKDAARECGATVLNVATHKFVPQGLTAVILLSESHISVHTFPEQGTAAFDIFTCGEADSSIGVQYILEHVNCQYHTLIDIRR